MKENFHLEVISLERYCDSCPKTLDQQIVWYNKISALR